MRRAGTGTGTGGHGSCFLKAATVEILLTGLYCNRLKKIAHRTPPAFLPKPKPPHGVGHDELIKKQKTKNRQAVFVYFVSSPPSQKRHHLPNTFKMETFYVLGKGTRWSQRGKNRVRLGHTRLVTATTVIELRLLQYDCYDQSSSTGFSNNTAVGNRTNHDYERGNP